MKKLRLEEKQRKLAATAALLKGRNADGLVSDFIPTSTFLSLIPLFLTSTSLRSGSAFLKITPYSTRSFKKKRKEKKKEAITVDHRDEKFMNDYSVINYLHKSH